MLISMMQHKYFSKIPIRIMDYVSLFLVISFFVLHNIYIVIFGIIIALYLINKNYIKDKILTINSIFLINEECNLKDIDNTDLTIPESIKEDSILTLVEKIEKYGYIPSIIKEDNIDAA